MLYEDLSKEYIKPSRLIGNLYFVGLYNASTHIFDTGEGLILLDPGYLEGLSMVLDNIKALGFDAKDIKYILVSHAHLDHMDAVKPLVSMTGAKTFIGKDDMPLLRGEIFHYPINPFEPDVLLSDGDVVTLGNTSIRCLSTPGHTDGTMSFFFDVTENGVTYKAGMFGGAGCNTLYKEFLDKYSLPYEMRQKYLNSVLRLRTEEVDVFVGNHVWNNNTDGKIAALATSEKNPFIVPGEWQAFLEGRLAAIEKIIRDND